MADKIYDNIESKQRVRNRFKKFVRKHMGELGRPNELTYFCLPGVTAREIIEITDPLNIPRENIVCAEIDEQKYEKLKKLGLGTELYLGSDLDFFRGTEREFDIISLDYEGKFFGRNVVSLCTIASKHILKPKGILTTNFYGKREGEKEKSTYLGPGTKNFQDKQKIEEEDNAVKQFLKVTKQLDIHKDIPDDIFPEILNFKDKIAKDKTLDDFRDYGITSNIIDIFFRANQGAPGYLIDSLKGKNFYLLFPSAICSLYEINPDFKKINEENRKYLINSKKESIELNERLKNDKIWLEKNEDYLIKNPDDTPEKRIEKYNEDIEILKKIPDKEFLMRNGLFSFKTHDKSVVSFLKKGFGISDEHANAILNFYNYRDFKRYLCKDNERYRYISDAGSQMFSDIFFFDQFKDYFETYKEIIKPVEINGKNRVMFQGNLYSSFLKFPITQKIHNIYNRNTTGVFTGGPS